MLWWWLSRFCEGLNDQMRSIHIVSWYIIDVWSYNEGMAHPAAMIQWRIRMVDDGCLMVVADGRGWSMFSHAWRGFHGQSIRTPDGVCTLKSDWASEHESCELPELNNKWMQLCNHTLWVHKSVPPTEPNLVDWSNRLGYISWHPDFLRVEFWK